MYKLLVLVVATILMSCSLMDVNKSKHATSPGYQFGRQMDEKSLRAGFVERK